MSISLCVESYCESCNDFEPVKEVLYADFKPYITTVYCANRHRCAAIYNKIKEDFTDEAMSSTEQG